MKKLLLLLVAILLFIGCNKDEDKDDNNNKSETIKCIADCSKAQFYVRADVNGNVVGGGHLQVKHWEEEYALGSGDRIDLIAMNEALQCSLSVQILYKGVVVASDSDYFIHLDNTVPVSYTIP